MSAIDRINWKLAKLNKWLLADVEHYRHGSCNAQHAIGYLFNPLGNNREIATGMYCHQEREITKEWMYFVEFSTQTIYKVS